MINNVDKIWVERYRPQTVADCILPTRAKQVAQSFVGKGKMPNLLLAGGAGCGKTTLAKALCNEMGYDFIVINGSNEGRLIDTLRSKITDFASSVSFTGARKVVILDEAEYMPSDTVQVALRNFIEEYSDNCGFIFTCNFPNRIIDPLHSRTTSIDFTISSEEKSTLAKEMFSRVIEILDENEVKYDKKAIAEVVKTHFPDFRRTLNELQRYASTGMIDAGILTISSGADIEALIEILREKDFTQMRKWVGSQTSLDMTSICRKIYDKMGDILEPQCMPQIVLDIADYQYKDNFVADKEINMAALLTTIMMNAEFK